MTTEREAEYIFYMACAVCGKGERAVSECAARLAEDI